MNQIEEIWFESGMESETTSFGNILNGSSFGQNAIEEDANPREEGESSGGIPTWVKDMENLQWIRLVFVIFRC